MAIPLELILRCAKETTFDLLSAILERVIRNILPSHITDITGYTLQMNDNNVNYWISKGSIISILKMFKGNIELTAFIFAI